MPDTQSRPVNIFISYSLEDEFWRDHFLDFLKPVLRRGLVDTFTDQDIQASQNWSNEIDRAMETADVGLLLVSKNFLKSDFIMDTELPYFIESHEDGKCAIVWVLLESCLWEETDLQSLQSVNTKTRRPLRSYKGNGRADETVKIIKELLDVGQQAVVANDGRLEDAAEEYEIPFNAQNKANELKNSLSRAENEDRPGVALLGNEQHNGKEVINTFAEILRQQEEDYLLIQVQPDVRSTNNDKLYERLRRDLEWGLKTALQVKRLTTEWETAFDDQSGSQKELFRDSVERLVEIANANGKQILLLVTELERVDDTVLQEWSAMLHDLCRYGLRIIARGGNELRGLINSTDGPGSSAFHELLPVELLEE